MSGEDHSVSIWLENIVPVYEGLGKTVPPYQYLLLGGRAEAPCYSPVCCLHKSASTARQEAFVLWVEDGEQMGGQVGGLTG